MPVKHSGLPPDKWIAEAQKRLRQLPTKVANTAHRHFARNFETESWEGQKWPPRSPWAVRNQGRHLLRDTGTLFRALSKEVSGSRMRIFIALPADLPPLHPMFRINVGINPIIYSPRHPYFASIPAEVLANILKASDELQKFNTERLNVLLLDRAKQFTPLDVPGRRGKVLLHKLVNTNASDYKEVLAEAMFKASQGNVVELLPELNSEEIDFFYEKVFPNSKHHGKQPDFRINYTDYADLKCPKGKGKNTFKNNISSAAKQCEHAIIKLRQVHSWKQLKLDCRLKMEKDFKNLQSVEIINGKLRKVFTRKKLGL